MNINDAIKRLGSILIKNSENSDSQTIKNATIKTDKGEFEVIELKEGSEINAEDGEYVLDDGSLMTVKDKKIVKLTSIEINNNDEIARLENRIVSLENSLMQTITVVEQKISEIHNSFGKSTAELKNSTIELKNSIDKINSAAPKVKEVIIEKPESKKTNSDYESRLKMFRSVK